MGWCLPFVRRKNYDSSVDGPKLMTGLCVCDFARDTRSACVNIVALKISESKHVCRAQSTHTRTHESEIARRDVMEARVPSGAARRPSWRQAVLQASPARVCVYEEGEEKGGAHVNVG